MERISRVRAIFLISLFSLGMLLYGIKLFDIQVIETGGVGKNNVTTYTSYTTVQADRGDILDRNGNVMVGDRASYNLVFNHYVIKSTENRNQYLYDLIQRSQELGLTYTDHFPITKTRPFAYTLENYSAAWQGYFQSYLTDMNLDSDMTAPLLMETLRDRYKIPAEWTMDEARAVIGLRYEFDLRGVAGLANYVFVEDISDEDLAEIVELNIPGLNVEPSTVREYHTKYAAHILGFTGAMDTTDWGYYKTLDGRYNMDDHIGQSGLEEAFEEYLHGVDGTRVDVVAQDGTIISQEYKAGKEPKAGNNLETTLDINIQMVTEDAMADLVYELVNNGGDGAGIDGMAAVVMEVKTGDILACASYPTYDLETFRENYSEIAAADNDPMFNRALKGTYPPGSTYKMSTLVAAMEHGALGYGEKIVTRGQFTKYAPFKPACLTWYNTGGIHGTIDATVAIQKSCNYFFFELADRMTIDEIDETAAALGLGEPTGVELEEDKGWRANPANKAELAKIYQGGDPTWYNGDRINTGIGQSENRFTPIQLCVYACTLANQGVRYRATFLNRVVSADYRTLVLENTPEIVSTYEMSDSTYEMVLEGMKKVALPGGTGYTNLRGTNVEVAAKTGTAEHGLGSQYEDHGAFVCFAPADDPQIAIAIYGEKAAHGSTLGKVAKTILNAYFNNQGESDTASAENKLS